MHKITIVNADFESKLMHLGKLTACLVYPESGDCVQHCSVGTGNSPGDIIETISAKHRARVQWDQVESPCNFLVDEDRT